MDRPKIRLLADRILVEVQKTAEVKTASGLIIPETASKESALVGKVLRTSKKVATNTEEDEQILEGDLVLFSKFAGSDVLYNQKEYKVLRITDLFGVLEE